MSITHLNLTLSQPDIFLKESLNLGTGSPIVKLTTSKGVFVDRGFEFFLSPEEIQNEIQITLWASQHDIAPKVQSYNMIHMVMEWIDGKHIQELSLDQVADLAATFRKMHSLPAPMGITKATQPRFVDQFLKIYLQMKQVTSIPNYLKIIKTKILEETKQQEKLVCCHGDVHANNVIWAKDRLYLIDWTCSGLDFPIYDLAVSSMFWNFTASQDGHLLKSYFQKIPDEDCIQKFTVFKNFARICWAMWPIVKILADFPQKAKDLGDILEKRIKIPTLRTFEEYRRSLFDGTFKALVREPDDWIDVHLARIQASNFNTY